MTNYSLMNISQVIIKYTNNDGKNKNVHFNCVENYQFYADMGKKEFGFVVSAAGNDFWNGFHKDLTNNEIESFVVSVKGTRFNEETEAVENYWYLKNEKFANCSISYSGEDEELICVSCHSCKCCDCDCE